MKTANYEEFIRARITELRIAKNVSEHRMSLDLDKSGFYIRGITNGLSMPSVKELFNIIFYFDMTPLEFFMPWRDESSLRDELCAQLQNLDDKQLEKVQVFLKLID